MRLACPVFIAVILTALGPLGGQAAEIEDCLRSKKCRGLVETSFGEIFPRLLQEVEAALPGRFFADTVTYAEKSMDLEGHFLKVDCLSENSCSKANREILEERILSVGLLMSLPMKASLRGQCYHPQTWALTAAGESVLARAQTAYPEIKIRIALLAAKILKRPR